MSVWRIRVEEFSEFEREVLEYEGDSGARWEVPGLASRAPHDLGGIGGLGAPRDSFRAANAT